MPEQTTDEVLAEVAEIRRPQPGDTFVDKALIWFLGKLENRLRAKREHSKSLEEKLERLKAEAETHEAEYERLKAICEERGIEYPGREGPPKSDK